MLANEEHGPSGQRQPRAVMAVACVVLCLGSAVTVRAQTDPSSETTPSVESGESSEPAADPAADPARAVIVYAQPMGVDPVVARFVTEAVGVATKNAGYAIVDPAATERCAQQVTLSYPPSAADLWRLTYACRAQRGLFARVWAEGGQYVTEVLVASVDGAGPFVQRGSSGAQELPATVQALVAQTLPPPGVMPPVAQPVMPAAGGRLETNQARDAAQPSTFDATLPVRDEAAELGSRWSLAVQTEAAVGLGGDGFYNHMLGLRLDHRFTRDLYAGAYVGYANVRGRGQRGDNLLMYAQVDNRIPIVLGGPLAIPLRVGMGYLPRNGAVLRLATGLIYEVSSSVAVGAELFSPMFWVVRDRVLFSLDFAVELSVKL